VIGQRIPVDARSVVDATLLNKRVPGKPPHTTYFIDVRLRNPTSDARWLVVATDLGTTPLRDSDEGLQAAGVHAYVLSTKPLLVLFEALGAGVVAVKLPGHGFATVRQLRIASVTWEQFAMASGDTSELDVIVAREIDVGGVSFESMVKGPSLSESMADARAPNESQISMPTFSWEPPSCRPREEQSPKAAAHGAPPAHWGPLNITADYLTRAAVVVP
jgi:hypothetical protein